MHSLLVYYSQIQLLAGSAFWGVAKPSRTFFVLVSSSFINTIAFVSCENLCEGRGSSAVVHRLMLKQGLFLAYTHMEGTQSSCSPSSSSPPPASPPLLSSPVSQHILGQMVKFPPQKVGGGRRSNTSSEIPSGPACKQRKRPCQGSTQGCKDQSPVNV